MYMHIIPVSVSISEASSVDPPYGSSSSGTMATGVDVGVDVGVDAFFCTPAKSTNVLFNPLLVKLHLVSYNYWRRPYNTCTCR